jgi:CHAT domain-containing protein
METMTRKKHWLLLFIILMINQGCAVTSDIVGNVVTATLPKSGENSIFQLQKLYLDGNFSKFIYHFEKKYQISYSPKSNSFSYLKFPDFLYFNRCYIHSLIENREYGKAETYIRLFYNKHPEYKYNYIPSKSAAGPNFIWEIRLYKSYLDWLATKNRQVFDTLISNDSFKSLSPPDIIFIGMIYERYVGDFNKAIEIYQFAIRKAQNLGFIHFDSKMAYTLLGTRRLVSLYIKIGLLKEAETSLFTYENNTKGLLYNIGGSIAKHIPRYDAFLSIIDIEAGALYSILRNFEKSDELFAKSKDIILEIEKTPEAKICGSWESQAIANFYIKRGMFLYGLQEKNNEAKKDLEKGLQYISENQLDIAGLDLSKSSAFLYYSDLTYRMNEFERSIYFAKQALKLSSQNREIKNIIKSQSKIARVFMARGELDKAGKIYHLIEKDIDKDVIDNWNILYDIAKYYMQVSDFNLAQSYLDKIIIIISKLYYNKLSNPIDQYEFSKNIFNVFEDQIYICVKINDKLKAFNYLEILKSISFYKHFPYIDTSALYSINLQTAKDILSVFNENEAGISYFIGNKHSFAFIINRNRLDIINIAIVNSEINELVTHIRQAIPDKINFKDSPRVRHASFNLYKSLVQPAVELIKNKNKVLISPHRSLNNLPFDVLTKECDPPEEILPSLLINFYNFVFIPNFSFMLRANDPNFNEINRISAFGDLPRLSYSCFSDESTDKLEHSCKDIAELKLLYPNTRTFVRQDASETNFYNALQNSDLIFVASHAKVVSSSPLNSCILLAKDSTENGRVTVSELANKKISAKLVFLSACDTGHFVSYDGKENEFGMGGGLFALNRVFLQAGVSNVVSTLWSVDDESTSQFTKLFFEQFSKLHEPSFAVRRSKLIFIREINEMPYFWAGITIWGI